MPIKPPKERKIGTVEHYYPRPGAATVGLEGDLRLGDTIHIKGHGDDLMERVTSLQLDHEPIEEAHAGQHVGVQVLGKVHEKAEVFKLEPRPRRARTLAKPRKTTRKTSHKPSPPRKVASKRAATKRSAKRPAKKVNRASRSSNGRRRASAASRRGPPKRAPREPS